MADTVILIAGGDIGPQIEPVDKLADLISPILQQADLRFANAERLYSERGAEHGYGHGYPHPRLASIFDKAQIDVISMANSHGMRIGADALIETIDLFRGMGKHVIGGGKNIGEARKPAVVERNGIKIAFLAYCSALKAGHEARSDKTGLAPMRVIARYTENDPNDPPQPGEPLKCITTPHEEDLHALRQDIGKAKARADVVVMSIHWGLPYVEKTILDYQPAVAHAAIDAGADLILGHHPHCLRAIEVYKGKVCFYSLGNLMMTHTAKSDRQDPAHWNRWNLWWYRIDPECLPPHGIYDYPPNCRKTMLAKIVFAKKGVERVSFLPAYINPQAQPAIVTPHEPRFREMLDYIEWLSDQVPHRFRVEGGEIVVTPAPGPTRIKPSSQPF